MNEHSLSKVASQRVRDRSWIAPMWIGASSLGPWIGTLIALVVFPSAAFGEHPIGSFSWKLVGFAASIGICLAISQCVALGYILGFRELSHPVILILWVPVTASGITLMILPLWNWNAEVFVMLPMLVAKPMFPGMLFLGLSQWLLLYLLIRARVRWVLFTVIGAGVGSVGGLIGAFILQPIPLELTWASLTGAGIGALQAIELQHAIGESPKKFGFTHEQSVNTHT